ncbi:hypothetical protein PYW07_007635 [Mythimna separata]|uniref:Endonuclease-reverse transcriptase n=1 Tax=Mythimna separata TaxID=271217 RepID=A0AAD7YNR3_MYTSE|nr:hypothetical protein PYW07_007635 [Mythimna separata]
MERNMSGIKLIDKINNIKIRAITKIQNIRERIRLLKWNWAGHVCRMENDRWTKKVTEWLPREETRSKGRPKTRHTHTDIFTQKVGPDWTRKARDREMWKTLGRPTPKRRLLSKSIFF